MDPAATAAKEIQLYDMTRGASWRGIPTIGPITQLPNGEPPAVAPSAALVSAEIIFYRIDKSGATEAITLRSDGTGDAPITIVDAATWELSVPRVDPDVWALAAGKYAGHLKIVDADGETWIPHLYRQNIRPAPPK